MNHGQTNSNIRGRARPRPGTAGGVGAFTLIEILIAIVVLALGLLGLAAVFPAVIAQQRAAIDETLGQSAATAAFAELTGGGDSIDWGLLLSDAEFGRFDGGSGLVRDGEQVGLISRFWDSGLGGGSQAVGEYLNDGTLVLGKVPLQFAFGTGPGPSALDLNNDGVDDSVGRRLANGTYENIEITSSARVFPALGTGQPPVYVWDAAVRRESATEVQIAIFVRRLGLQGSASQGVTDLILAGEPLFEGGTYPAPRVFSGAILSVDVDDPSVVELDPGVDALRRVGQRFVDDFAAVREVVGLTPSGVRVSPAYTAAEADFINAGGGAAPRRQVIYTEERPVRVEVRRVSR